MQTLKNRLNKIAIITSPIIACYGMAPIFLLQPIQMAPLLIAFLALTVLIIIFWGLNIWLTRLKLTLIKRYIISYVSTFLLQIAVLRLLPKSPESENILDLIFFSISSTAAINTIILIIINSALLKQKKDIADLEIQNLKMANLEAQKQVLMQQLQPHFLFNALSTLKSLIHENPDKAEAYSIHLSEFLRYSVHANQNDLIDLEKECDFTKDFLNLQTVRFGNALQWEITINESGYKKFIPVLSLQLLVENAIKHNSFTEHKPLYISIKADKDSISVSNNKSAKKFVLKSGIGLKNLKERYNFFDNDGVRIEEDEFNFFVHLKLLDK